MEKSRNPILFFQPVQSKIPLRNQTFLKHYRKIRTPFPAAREQNLFLDTSTKTYTRTFRITADEDYLYSYYESSEEKNQLQKMNGGMTVFDWSGKEIADIPFGEEIINHRGYMDEFCGTDEKYIYFLRKIYAASGLENPFGTDRSVYAKFYAIDKSDLEDGSYELHFAEAQPINE